MMSMKTHVKSLVGAFMFISVVMAVSVNTLSDPIDVTLTTLPPINARPGEFVTLVFTLDNPTASAESFDINLNLPDNFALINSVVQVTVAALDESLLFVTVLVPQSAQARNVEIVLEAISASDPVVRLTATAVVRVVAMTDLDVIAIEGQRPIDGGVEVTFSVINRGNIPDDVAFQASTQNNFQTIVSPAQATLIPGQPLEVRVVVAIPIAEGASQASERVTLRAQSLLDAARIAVGFIDVDLLPPPPQNVNTDLGASLPTQATLDFSKSSGSDDIGIIATLAAGGTIGGIDLSAQVAVDNTPSVRSSRLSLAGDLIEIAVGDVAARFDSFSSLSGRGARLTVGPRTTPSSTVSVIGIGATDLLAGALNATLNLGTLGTSVSALVREQGAVLDSLGSASVSLNFDQISASAQTALSQSEGLWDFALNGGASFTQGPISFGIDAFRGGPDFNGPGQNQAFITVDHQLTIETLVMDARVRFGVNGLIPEPPDPAIAFSDVRLVFNAFPGTGFPSWKGFFRQQTEKDITMPATVDTLSQSLVLSTAQTFSFASLSLAFGLDRTVDVNADQDLGSLSMSALLGWNEQGIARSIGASNTIGIDFGAGAFIDQIIEFTSTLSFSTPIGSVGFKLATVLPDATFSMSLSSGGPTLSLNALAEFNFVEAALSSYSARLSLTARFDTPLPFAPVNGQIEGLAFIDSNLNRRFDAGEQVVSLVLNAPGGRAISDDEGFFRFQPMPPGEYEVDLERPMTGYAPALDMPLKVSLNAGQRVRVLVPLIPVATVSGLVFNDTNENGEQDTSEFGMDNVTIILVDDVGTEVARTSTNANGRFGFSRMTPGNYVVRLDASSLSSAYKPSTETSLTINVAAQELVNVRFGLIEIPPEIRITVSAPLAEFSVTPQHPIAGEVVEFGASASFDLDGEIVIYKWDFDGDGIVDAEGVEASFSFAEAGEFTVTLSVTDNDGNTSQSEQVIIVEAE